MIERLRAVAIGRRVNANILTPDRAVRRNRAFEARERFDAFTDLERQPASPPDRPAPR